MSHHTALVPRTDLEVQSFNAVTMKTFLCIVSILATVAIVRAEDEGTTAPWFCHGLDCPSYKVLNTTDKYELRVYEGATWVGTKVESLLYSVGVAEGFQRLFKYISGDNKDQLKINMTVPVATHIVPGEGAFCKSTFDVGFFVPFKYQGKAPTPSNPAVRIFDTKTQTVAALGFGGFLVDDFTLGAKTKSLQKALEADGISYDNSSYFAVGYDPPTRLSHRHNEVWLSIKESSGLLPESSFATA